jgi:GntR family transcriptional regulator
MIQIDRQASTPLAEQVAEQVRFLIATGRYVAGDAVPSTRELARHLGISYHTVRAAYHQLVTDGLLHHSPGSPYTVRAATERSLEDRLERGASVAQDAVRRLVALGFAEDEIAMMLEEQMAYLDEGPERPKVVFAAPYRELAEGGARELESAAQTPIYAATFSELERHPDAEVVVLPLASYAAAGRVLPPGADLVLVQMLLPPDVLAEVARMDPSRTLGLVTRYGDAVGPLLRELRHASGFTGPALALPADAERPRLAELLDQVDLLLYTPGAGRRLRPVLGKRRATPLAPTVDPRSMAAAVAAARR